MMQRHSPFPMVPVAEALACVLSHCSSLPEETVALPDAVGRVLSQGILATTAHPSFPASIMDGYAVQSSEGPGVFAVAADVTAGAGTPQVAVAAGQVAYITTGAPLPNGADAVVMVEETEAVDGQPDQVRIKANATPGDNSPCGV